MRVKAYRNLSRKCWSLKAVDGEYKGKVVGHCASCVIVDATPYVSVKSRLRLLPNKQREVHAWLEGDLHSVVGFQSFQGRDVAWGGNADSAPVDIMQKVTYHPFERDCFYWAASGEEYRGSGYAVFTAAMEVLA